MDKLSNLQIFIRVAELQSFTKASEELGIPKSSASNAVQELEDIAQVKLLHRTTRKVELSPEGFAFLERSKDILSDIDELETMFHSNPAQIRGKIRVDMTSVAARDVVVPKLPEFLKRYPEIEIEIVGSDQKLDLIREGIDCSIRSGETNDPRISEQLIGEIPILNLASPKYLEKYGTPKNPEDLKNHLIIQYVQMFGGDADTFDYFDGQKTVVIKMKSLISVANIDAYRAACVAGLGICQNPALGVRNLIRSGKLVEILPKYKLPPTPLKIVYPKKRVQSKRIKAFIEWVEPILTDYVNDKRR